MNTTHGSATMELDKAKEIINELEADIVGFSEHKINSKHRDNMNGM